MPNHKRGRTNDSTSQSRSPSQYQLGSSQSTQRYRTYAYKALTTLRSIRVLELLRYDVDARDIYGRLIPASLDDEDVMGNVAALSYTWGPATSDTQGWGRHSVQPEPTVALARLLLLDSSAGTNTQPSDDIPVQDRDFAEHSEFATVQLTENLSDFLPSFMRRAQTKLEHPQKKLRLWIDAICIDQGNTNEKATQIQLMGDIYSRAETVYIWLGKEDRDLRKFIWLHEVMMPALQAYERNFDQNRDFIRWLKRYSPTDPALWADRLGLEPPRGSGGDALTWADVWIEYMMFFDTRTWFNRAWTIQEAILPRNEPVIVLGRDFWTVSWGALMYLNNTVLSTWSNRIAETTFGDETIDRLNRGAGILVTDRMEIFKLRMEYEASLKGSYSIDFGLSWTRMWIILIGVARRKHCIDAHDKVFATFGVAKKLCPADAASTFPKVNLTVPVAQSFADVARFILSNPGGLHLLSLVEDRLRQSTPDLPSWTPDFVAPGDSGYILPSACNFSAAEHMEIAPLPRFNGRGMVFRGKRLDRIKVAPYFKNFVEMSIHAMATLLYVPEVYPATGESGSEALWRTLLCGSLGEGLSSNPALGQGFREWMLLDLAVNFYAEYSTLDPQYRMLLAQRYASSAKFRNRPFMPSGDEVLAAGESIPDALPDGYPIPCLSKLGQEFFTLMDDIVPFRHLFVTDGGLLVLAKLSCAAQDEVWLLAGGPVPYVLRPKGGGAYDFMGDCYVHGAMHGEFSMAEREELVEVCLV